MDEITRVCAAAKKRLVPTRKMREAVEACAEELRANVEHECKAAGLLAEVRLDGSVAKDTWIRDSADVDIFMRVSPQLTKTQLREVCLPIARRALRPHKIVERFAEHPYVESTVKLRDGESLRVNVVPCYKVEKGNWLSATDRSPYHTEYIKQHLTEKQRDEVRLLKAFMKGIGSYGADIKTGGFSGMLCETLILSRGDFPSVISDFKAWREEEFTDVEKYYEGRANEVHRIFREPLVVIDPVDKGRNLAAAVRQNQAWNFVAACRHFTTKPSTSIFAEPNVKPLTSTAYGKLLRFRGSTILCLVLGEIDTVVDVLWSQLYRTQRAIANLLEGNGFRIIRSVAWSDEKSLNVILLELDQGILPQARRHHGPPISRLRESTSFLEKHARNANTVSGPWIEGDRWVIQQRRSVVSAPGLLKSALRSGGANIGVAALPAKAFRNRLQILENHQIEKLVSSNREFAKAMTIYLSGRPAWLV